MKVQVSEEKIFQAIDIYKVLSGGESPEHFMEAIMNGTIFKTQGLTPIYIFDEEENTLVVTSEEHFSGKLN